jgi:hypothetical protein
MHLVAVLLLACTNVDDRSFFGDGERTATGQMPDGGGDTGSSDTDDDTGNGGGGADEDAPSITDASAYFDTLESSDSADFLFVQLAYTDVQGDVVGGKVFFDVIEDGGAPETDSRTVLEIMEVTDIATQAGDTGGSVLFAWGPVDTSKSYTVDAIVLKDTAGHESDPTALELSGAPSR